MLYIFDTKLLRTPRHAINTLPDSSGRKATGKVATLKIDLARSAARPCPQSQSLSFRQYQLMPVTKLAASGFSAKAVRKMLCKSSR